MRRKKKRKWEKDCSSRKLISTAPSTPDCKVKLDTAPRKREVQRKKKYFSSRFLLDWIGLMQSWPERLREFVWKFSIKLALRPSSVSLHYPIWVTKLCFGDFLKILPFKTSSISVIAWWANSAATKPSLYQIPRLHSLLQNALRKPYDVKWFLFSTRILQKNQHQQIII